MTTDPVIRRCEFSPCRSYRYTLWREWSDDLFANKAQPIGSYLMVIGLNPSTADETLDDPTIRRCKDFAKRWGFQALCMTNLFAWRDTDPDKMKLVADPVGPMNDHWLRECARGAGRVLAAWGKHGSHRGRADEVVKMIERELECLGSNGDGSPKHPLYIAANTAPIQF